MPFWVLTRVVFLSATAMSSNAYLPVLAAVGVKRQNSRLDWHDFMRLSSNRGYEIPRLNNVLTDAPAFSIREATGFEEKEDVVQLLDRYHKAQRFQQALDELQVVEDLHNEKRLAVP
jgi:hypothetical protein